MATDEPDPPSDEPDPPSDVPSKQRKSEDPTSTDDHIRRVLVYMLVMLIPAMALITVFMPTGGPVLDKLLPILALVVGYFFGSRVGRMRR